MSYIVRIIGGGQVGQQIADRLEYRGDDVCIVEEDEQRVALLNAEGYQVIHGDGTDLSVLRASDIDRADIVIAATGDDDTNLLTTQLVKTKFDVETILARVNEPSNEEPFEELGIQTISRSIATARLIDGYIESPALTRWTEGLGREGDLQEVPVTNDALVGNTIAEIDSELPDRCFVIVVGAEGGAHFPDLDEVIDRGQHLTLLGDRDAVRKGMKLLDPEPSTTTV
ncbi:TrkA family potassium uptake protein [Haloarcula sp. JP-L23]|uniref:potassium channel family protein n=1 Tax=Haloarcula sp. JP-L23 TaxID=2716717 RepID=UPI00140F3B9D|nr:TrkA family potassium uptake protein [Haloarcula sp. JP-L23]